MLVGDENYITVPRGVLYLERVEPHHGVAAVTDAAVAVDGEVIHQSVDVVHTVSSCVLNGFWACLQRFKVIPGLAQTLFAVFDGLCGTITDAGHAVGTVFAPDGLPIPQHNAVGRAAPGALAAADAGIADSKGVCPDKAGIENGVYRPAHKTVIKVVSRGSKGLTGANGGYGAVNTRLSRGHDLPCLIDVRSVEHGNVVLRHDDLCRAHADKTFCLTEHPVIFVGAADLAAAGHDEPCVPCSLKRCLQQPVSHKAGNAPGVGRRDDDKMFAGLYGRDVVGFDAVIHTEQRVIQRLRYTSGDVFAVACARKVKNHIHAPLRRRRWSGASSAVYMR